MYCWVAVEEGSNDVLREPCGIPCDFERDSEDGDVLVFRADASEVFRCEATVDVLRKVVSGAIVCLQLIYVVCRFV